MDDALLAGLLVGLVAIGLTSFGINHALAASNRLSLSVSLFVLFALFALTAACRRQGGWAGELLQRVNPMTAAEHYMRNIVINQYEWTKELDWLISPVAVAVGMSLIAVLVVPRFVTLRGGSSG